MEYFIIYTSFVFCAQNSHLRSKDPNRRCIDEVQQFYAHNMDKTSHRLAWGIPWSIEIWINRSCIHRYLHLTSMYHYAGRIITDSQSQIPSRSFLKIGFLRLKVNPLGMSHEEIPKTLRTISRIFILWDYSLYC